MSELVLGAYWNEKHQRYNYPSIPEVDRATHLYVIGASGQGKSRFLEYLITQDLGQHGFGVIDPHGDVNADGKIPKSAEIIFPTLGRS